MRFLRLELPISYIPAYRKEVMNSSLVTIIVAAFKQMRFEEVLRSSSYDLLYIYIIYSFISGILSSLREIQMVRNTNRTVHTPSPSLSLGGSFQPTHHLITL